VWTGTHNLYRAKNASQDLRRFDFQYRDEPWAETGDTIPIAETGDTIPIYRN
jgi:hypothetical protein